MYIRIVCLRHPRGVVKQKVVPLTRGCMADPNTPMFPNLPHSFRPFLYTPALPLIILHLISSPSPPYIFLAFFPSLPLKKKKMCSSKSNKPQGISSDVSHINGRPVLQPNCCNNIRSPSLLERRNSLKKSSSTKISSSPLQVPPSPPSPPTLKSPRHDSKCSTTNLVNKKTNNDNSLAFKNINNNICSSPGSIAAARREQVAIMQVQRKMRIAHYGRTKSAKYDTKIVPLDSSPITANVKDERRCHFITSNSGINIYIY